MRSTSALGRSGRRRLLAASALALLAVGLAPGVAGAAPPGEPIVARPIVIGHRGASGYRPEHTLAAYELAIDLGADFIEPDLVITSDRVLVARHEPVLAVVNATTGALIERTTDVNERAEFAGRRTTRTLDGVSLTGWWAQDFTLAELKTLRAVERLPALRPQNTAFDGMFQVPTFQEVVDLAQAKSAALGRTIGIYPETKHPTYHDGFGLSLEEPLLAILAAEGLTLPTSPVFIQSFEVANLKELNGRTQAPIVQLFGASGRPFDFTVAGDSRTYTDLSTPAGLAEIATYANGIGPDKNRIVPRNGQGFLQAPTALVDNAHNAGLLVHPYTFRSENNFLPADFRVGSDPKAYGNFAAEYRLFFDLGVDGLFSDNPDHANATRNQLAAVIPEAPVAALLPLFAIAVGGTALAVRRRRAEAVAPSA